MGWFDKLFKKKVYKAKNERRTSPHYLIEFRFQGKAKGWGKKLSADISKKFGVKRVARSGRPPHITLYGRFETANEKEMASRFLKVCKQFDLIKFRLNGFSHIENRVVQINVEPSQELKEFRKQLAAEMNSICNAQEWDNTQKEFLFHATLAFKDIESKFEKIWTYLQNSEQPNKSMYLIRTTLLKNGKILLEYDFIQRRALNRMEALNGKIMRTTIDYLKEIKANKGKRKETVFEETKNNVFFISDLHLDHKNIIKYTKRPFENVHEMNNVLVNNWNSTVKPNDTVYFLGDMVFGRGCRPATHWLKQLNGKIIFIEGNHEEVSGINSFPPAENVFLNYKGKKFLLVHDPALKPKDWNDWIIHGHHHNNHLEEFPFVNGDKKTINVSVELTDYKPVPIQTIINPELESIKYWKTIKDKIIKK